MKRLLCLPVAATAFAVAACGDAARQGTAAVAARVNGQEISVQQVAHVFAPGDDSLAPQKATKAQALERLIDQELLVQKALAIKLDRDPRVEQAIAAERRRILGLAYLDQAVPQAPPRGTGEIHKFFADNPALFERRRIYDTRELAAVVPAEHKAMLKAQVGHAAHLDQVARWLKAEGLPFEDIRATRPAEQIPLEMLPQLAGMQDAQIALFAAPAAPDRVAIVQLVSTQDAPLSEPQAAPVIERMLRNRWRLELAMKEVKRLREAADIEYLGQFDAGRTEPKGPPGAGRLRPADEAIARPGPDLL